MCPFVNFKFIEKRKYVEKEKEGTSNQSPFSKPFLRFLANAASNEKTKSSYYNVVTRSFFSWRQSHRHLFISFYLWRSWKFCLNSNKMNISFARLSLWWFPCFEKCRLENKMTWWSEGFRKDTVEMIVQYSKFGMCLIKYWIVILFAKVNNLFELITLLFQYQIGNIFFSLKIPKFYLMLLLFFD